ncbi:MAG TPA: TraB/GumN family protein [Steroidobacteraceae bacterium]|nr:TraB/GumN family protein [Steroidobacteraceae bacterium]
MRSSIALCLLLLSCATFAQTESSEPETVLVQGERPGPGLWKISRDGHVLYLLGTHSPLPVSMTWKSAQVENAISEANEVLGTYAVSLKVPEQVQRNTRKPLKSVLPSRSYREWRKLKDKYLGNALPTEKLLPAEAAILLQSSAYRRNGLVDSQDIWRTIYKLAHDYRVPVRRMDYELDLGLTKPLKTNSRAGVTFLEETMQRLDADIKQAVARANAWADGDVNELRSLAEADASYASLLARSWPYLTKAQSDQAAQQAENRLVSELDRALRRNRTTFAGLPIYLIFKQDGPLAAMRSLGCAVEEPQ